MQYQELKSYLLPHYEDVGVSKMEGSEGLAAWFLSAAAIDAKI